MSYENYFDTDSEFFREYLRIIKKNNDLPKVRTTGRQLHHIIPRSFFNKREREVDNSSDNLVSLSQSEHWLCHWLIWHCALTGLRGVAYAAISQMTRPILHGIYTIDDARAVSRFAGYARQEISDKSLIIKKKKRKKRGVDDMIKDLWANLPE